MKNCSVGGVRSGVVYGSEQIMLLEKSNIEKMN